MGRGKESGFLDTFDLSKTDRLEDNDPKAMAYRVRGVPFGFDKAGAKSLLQEALETEDVTVDSLAAGSSKQVATIRVAGKPVKLVGWGISKRQWQVSARGVSMTVDTHFGGFTPLHDPEGGVDSFVDCVVISGLGSHAFGSWKDRDSDHMWLRDALPEQLPAARVLIYGYDSKLAKSNSFQNLSDVASRFRDSLQIALGKRRSCRPLIFIAHSLGGLILKQAIVQMKSGDAADLENLKSTFAILFFGVPNQGMDIRSLLAMVHGQPNLPFLATLDKNNGLLYELVDNFQAVFDFRDSHVVSFYETAQSPTARFSEGKWSMTGEPAVLVDRYSAKSGRVWEDKPSHLYPINCTHSEMVKFPEHDEDCERVLDKLRSFAEDAPAIIRARFNDHVGAKGALSPRTDSSYPGSSAALASSASRSFPGSSQTTAKSINRARVAVSMGSIRKDEAPDLVRSALATDVADNRNLTLMQEPKDTATEDPVHAHEMIRSFPMFPLSSDSRETEVLEVKARVIFDETIGQNYRHGRTGYLRVGVLFITWEGDDMQCKDTEVDKFREFLGETFHFETEHFEIPSERSETDLILKVSTFISSYNSPECLAIIYYGGHAYEGRETKKFKLAAKFSNVDGDGDPTAFFDDIRHCLRPASCDQLLILDCSFSARAFSTEPMGKRRFELLTSVTSSEHSPAPHSPASFTRHLSDAMIRLLREYPTGFSTSTLYREMYHAFKGQPLGSTWQPMHFDESRYDYGKIWLRPQRLHAKHKLAEQSKHADQSEGMLAEERFGLDLTFTIGKRPDLAVMNELAMNLRFLPHVDKISFRSLYSPLERLANVLQAVVYAVRVRAKFRALKLQHEYRR